MHCGFAGRRDIFVSGLNDNRVKDEVRIVKFDPIRRKEEILGNLQHRFYNGCGRTFLGCVEDRIFLIGGHIPSMQLVTSFNVVTRRQQSVAAMTSPRSRCAVASSQYELLVCGGYGRSYPLSSCELLQVRRNRWVEMPNLKQARLNFQVVWLPTGEIFAIGGNNNRDGDFNSVEFLIKRWDGTGVTAEQWRNVAPMLIRRSEFGAVSLPHGILVAGGWERMFIDYLKSVELFSPTNECGQWTQVQPMQTGMLISSGVVFNGTVCMFSSERGKKIQRLNPREDENITQWWWDEVASLHSVLWSIQATSFE